MYMHGHCKTTTSQSEHTSSCSYVVNCGDIDGHFPAQHPSEKNSTHRHIAITLVHRVSILVQIHVRIWRKNSMKTDIFFKTMSYLINTGYRIAGIKFRGKTFRKVFTDLIFCGIAFASMHARVTKHLYPRNYPL